MNDLINKLEGKVVESVEATTWKGERPRCSSIVITFTDGSKLGCAAWSEHFIDLGLDLIDGTTISIQPAMGNVLTVNKSQVLE